MADENTIHRMRTGHLNQTTECPCGKVLSGNGWKSHARVCPSWLALNGWPLDSGLKAAIWAETDRTAAVQAAEKAVAEKVLARRAAGNLTPPSWEEVKGWAWAAADPPHTA